MADIVGESVVHMDIIVKRNGCGDFSICNIDGKNCNKQTKVDMLEEFDEYLKNVLHEFDIATGTIRVGIETMKAHEDGFEVEYENKYLKLSAILKRPVK